MVVNLFVCFSVRLHACVCLVACVFDCTVACLLVCLCVRAWLLDCVFACLVACVFVCLCVATVSLRVCVSVRLSVRVFGCIYIYVGLFAGVFG